jgi:hypothetical protein
MSALAATSFTVGTLLALALGALGAGLGVTVAFSSVIYCADRSIELRRAQRPMAAAALIGAAAIAGILCLTLIVGGLILVVAKPK